MAERALHEMRALIRLSQEETAKALEKRRKETEEQEERRKQAELQAQQEEQKKAALSAKEKAQKKGEEWRKIRRKVSIYGSRYGESNVGKWTQCSKSPFFTGLQNRAEDSTLRWYKELQEAANQCAQSFEDLNSTKDLQVGACFSP